MGNRIRLIAKCILFIAVTCVCVGLVNHLLTPKYYYNDSWPTSNTYKDFYGLDKDSTDVLFFGSSHAVSAFDPQVIYDTYGITSYNMSCEQQSPVITYFWLREALKYQSPKAVVLDTYTLFRYTDVYVYNDMNCNEPAVRKAMDHMRLSPLKIEAASTIEKIDPSQNGLSYLLPNIRYHTRWKKLGENDYTEREMVKHGGIKGFSLQGGGGSPGLADAVFSKEDIDKADAEPMIDIADEYLDKITDLCRREGITLIFTSIPYGESIERYKSTLEYAEKNDIPLYDFNEENLYRETGYNAEKYRYSHINYQGAEKVSLRMGKILADEYGISSKPDPSFEHTGILHRHLISNIELSETTDAYKYLEMLNNSDYSIFVMAATGNLEYADDTIVEKWTGLGFTADLRNIQGNYHYCAVKSDTIKEDLTDEDINITGSVRDGRTLYSYTIDTSVMMPEFWTYSMKVDGNECGNRGNGLNIVVYDNDLKCIIDKVNIDLSSEGRAITRY